MKKKTTKNKAKKSLKILTKKTKLVKKTVKKILKKSSKKPVSKKTSIKAKSTKGSSIKKTTTSEVPPIAASPSSPIRAPMRKIIGEGNTLIVLHKPSITAATISDAVTPATSEAIVINRESVKKELAALPRAVVIPIKPDTTINTETPKQFEWDNLPKSFPAQLKFLIKAAKNLCATADSNPFGFAKFISGLPTKVCGAGFALMLMKKDYSEDEIARLCGLELAEVNARIQHSKSVIETFFSLACSEMYRKWNAQLRGTLKNVDAIIEPYLISKIDRDFQIMVGEVLLIVVGAEYISTGKDSTDTWRIAQ